MSDCLPYDQTRRFSKLFLDYIKQKQSVQEFYNRFPNPENFKAQIQDKQKNYQDTHRKILVETLKQQYQNFSISKSTAHHIELLERSNTFTITTGHQLNLFTGPLYTFYKIISVINSCQQLQTKYPEYNFVPIFWLASEDHDFEEINHFFYKDKKIMWPKETAGAVGEIKNDGLNQVLKEFEKVLPKTKNTDHLIQLFTDAYLKHKNLSQASIYLYNELFGEQGLVILEPNHPKLKACFKPYIRTELFQRPTHKKVSDTTHTLLKKNYHQQVSPREINLFYKNDNLRERLIYKDEKYYVNQTELVFTKDEIDKHIDKYPERFSPNALLRPLYQEVLLPNLSYVGGAGELAYWLQLRSTFKTFGVTFPMLQMRNSVLLVSQKSIKKLKKLNLKTQDLFQSPDELENQHIEQVSKIKIDFSPQKKHLSKQFKNLYELAEKTDKSFLNAVAAQEKKQHNGLDKLEKRLLKAQKRKMDDETKRVSKLQDKLFPHQKLQERHVNFFELYLSYGKDFKTHLIKALNPFDYQFSIIRLESKPLSL